MFSSFVWHITVGLKIQQKKTPINTMQNFTMLDKLGEGAFSQVYRVRDRITGQEFAAKILNQPFKNTAQVNRNQELAILRRLDYHTNVLTMVDHMFDSRHLVMLFHIMDGSLFDFIKDRKRKLSETKCQDFLHQMALGLSFIHANGIFHRDIKPENILVRTDRSCYAHELLQIGDFGTVAMSDRPQPLSPYMGTRWYRPPECLLTHGLYGPKMDVWAVGCVFYEILTLDALFMGNTELDQLDKIHELLGSPSDDMLRRFNVAYDFPKRSRVDWFKLLPGLSHYGVDILRRMLTYHPANRVSADKLLQHHYFRDAKARDSIAVRIMLSTPVRARTASSSGSLASRAKSEGLTKIENELTRRVKKQKERTWNMPECEKKRSMIEAERRSRVGSRIVQL
jgi:renal tumor antigen